ncbi:hypothetical protein [Streptomyces sp. H39-S7]|uniref:hypothetical protein n=1 Tax=Streptomyces sp. H39-S7 TaxID=3004357 RepID=UPI0022AF65E6|nr:hypothetical protein [Streptomyces sp. H39-S7]MCZ4120274.1 hypothetical protein [Streptomyces sp. H39-S7]
MDLDDVADQLYGLRPEEFIAARSEHAAAAKKAGDRELAGQITALRRPSLSAWASNVLVREQPDVADPLVALGEQLRQAHQDLDGEQLRELGRQQRQLVAALARQARQLASQAGHQLGDDVQREIEETLQAVLASPEAAQAWAGGRLVKALTRPAGFPGVAPGATPTPPKPAAAGKPAASRPKADAAHDRRRQELDQARQDARQAAEVLRGRQEAADDAARDVEAAAKEAVELKERAADLAEQLKQTQQEQGKAADRARRAKDRAREADRELREARRRAQRADARVERLSDADGQGSM